MFNILESHYIPPILPPIPPLPIHLPPPHPPWIGDWVGVGGFVVGEEDGVEGERGIEEGLGWAGGKFKSEIMINWVPTWSRLSRYNKSDQFYKLKNQVRNSIQKNLCHSQWYDPSEGMNKSPYLGFPSNRLLQFSRTSNRSSSILGWLIAVFCPSTLHLPAWNCMEPAWCSAKLRVSLQMAKMSSQKGVLLSSTLILLLLRTFFSSFVKKLQKDLVVTSSMPW